MSILCILALLFVAVGVASSAEASELVDETSLLQTTVKTLGPPPALDVAFSIPLPPGHYESGGMECGLNHSEDLYKYIPDVLAEHPGVDGFCYFERHAPWMSYTGPTQDYVASGQAGVLGMRHNRNMCPFFPGEGKGPLVLNSYEGVTLWSHVDCMHQTGDDKYCHALGWLRNQRLDFSLMSNKTAWEELAEQECRRMNETYHFTHEETTVGKHIDDQGVIWSDPQLTARNLNLHAFHKCALGHAADEMAYCMTLSCLLPPGNVVGHGPWCECGASSCP